MLTDRTEAGAGQKERSPDPADAFRRFEIRSNFYTKRINRKGRNADMEVLTR